MRARGGGEGESYVVEGGSWWAAPGTVSRARIRSAPWYLVAPTLLALSGSSCLIATYRHASFEEPNLAVRRAILPNGLQVVLEKENGASMVGVALTVGVGAEADPPGQEGLAHLVEHLAFRSRVAGGYTVTETIEYAGAASHNAETDRDSTTYVSTGPRASLRGLLAAAAAQLAGPKVDPEVLGVEQAVVLAELAQGSDQSRQDAWKWWVREAVYPEGHPARRPAIGTARSLRAIGPEDVATFVRTFYRPERATLAVTGGFSPEELFGALAVLFPAPAPPVARPAPTAPEPQDPPALPAVRLVHQTAPSSDEELYLVWSLPNRFERPAAPHVLYWTVARMFEFFSRDEKRIKDYEVFLEVAQRDSQLVCRLTLEPGTDPEVMMRTITARMDNFIEPSTRYELWQIQPGRLDTFRTKAVTRAMFRSQLAQASGEGKATWGEAFTWRPSEWRTEARWIGGDRARGVHVSNGGLDRAVLPDRALRVLPAQRNSSVQFGTEAVRLVALPLDSRRAEVEQLESGLQVVVLPTKRFTHPALALLLPGGSSVARPPGVAEVGLDLGTTYMSGLDSPRSAGAVSSRSLSADGLTYVLEGEVQNLDSMVGWLGDRLRGTWTVGMGETLFNAKLGRKLDDLDRSMPFQTRRAFVHALWGPGHPYGGHDLSPRAAAAAVTREDVIAWHEQTYAPGQAVLAVVGDVDPDQVLTLARRFLGAPKPRPAVLVPPLPPRPAHTRALLGPVVGMNQVALSWACQAPAVSPRQTALNELVATWLDTRLTDLLRDRSGIAYTSHAGSVRYWGGAGALLASTQVAGQHLAGVLRTMDEVLSGQGLDQRQLLNAAWDVLRARNGQYELPGPFAVDLAYRVREGWAPEALDEFPETVTQATPGEVRAVLAGCRASEVYEFLGDAKVVKAGVAASGLGARVELELVKVPVASAPELVDDP